jgi:hypothetical protein
MPTRIPQSVAIRVPLQAYLSSDHISPATGKTIAVTISKNGAGYGNPNAGATNASEVGGAGNGVGSYYVDLDTTDTGTAGPLFVKGTEGTIDNVIGIYLVVDAHNAGFDGVPSVTAGAANGLPINGSNTGPVSWSGGWTITNSTGTALSLTSLGSNGAGLAATGNGTGHGMLGISGFGATGDGLRGIALSTNGNGISGVGSGVGAGVLGLGGTNGEGIRAVAQGIGIGLRVTSVSGDAISGIALTSGNGLVLTATGASKHGAVVTGGTAGVSDGIKAVAGTGGVDIRGDITGDITGDVIGTVSTVTNLTNAATNGDLTATMKASVNAEMVDALSVDTYAEPGQGAPPATGSIVSKLGYVFKAWRNHSDQTDTLYQLYADDGVTVDQKAVVSDNGVTFDRGEVASGP